MNMLLSRLAFLHVGFMPKFLNTCSSCICVCMFMLSVHTVVAPHAQSFSCPGPVQSVCKHPVSQHKQRKFYISLRSAKKWKQMTSDNSLACRSISSTETLWPTTLCYWNSPPSGCFSLRGSGSRLLLLNTGLLISRWKTSAGSSMQSWSALQKNWWFCPLPPLYSLPPPIFFFFPFFLFYKRNLGKVWREIVFAELLRSLVTNESWKSMTRHVNLS